MPGLHVYEMTNDDQTLEGISFVWMLESGEKWCL